MRRTSGSPAHEEHTRWQSRTSRGGYVGLHVSLLSVSSVDSGGTCSHSRTRLSDGLGFGPMMLRKVLFLRRSMLAVLRSKSQTPIACFYRLLC
jgi:hypothetical protein